MSTSDNDKEIEQFVTIYDSEYDAENEEEIVENLANYAVGDSLPTFIKVDMEKRYPEEILVYMARMLPMQNLQVKNLRIYF